MLRANAEPAYVVYPATALDGPVYRVVANCPPTRDDFQSYLVAGKPFPPRLFFRATGVSMFTKRAEALKLARGGRLGTCIAELRLDDDRLFFALTNERTGHIDVWGFARLLVNCVVSCADVGKRR